MKLKTLLVSAVALLCSAASWGYTTTDLTSAGWKKITSISQNEIGDNYYIFLSQDESLILRLEVSSTQGNNAAFFRALADPSSDEAMMWTLEKNGSDYCMRNVGTSILQMQTEYSETSNDLRWRTNDQKFPIEWTGLSLSYSDSYWTLTSTKYSRPLGIYNNVAGTPTDGNEVGANDVMNGQKFNIYAMSRTDYSTKYAPTASSSNPVNVTSYITNPEVLQGNNKGVMPTGWSEDTSIRSAGNNNRTAAANAYTWLEGWTASATDNSLKVKYYQTINTIPNGKYIVKAIAGDNNGTGGGKIYISNGTDEQTANMSTAEAEIATNAVLTTNNSITIGMTAQGKNSWVHATNFHLYYLGNAVSYYSPTIFTNNTSATGETWYTFNVETAGTYKVESSNTATIYYTQDDSEDAANTENVEIAASKSTTIGLTKGTLYFKSSATSTINITPLVLDGTYYLYNQRFDRFYSRGSWWGTRAVADIYGTPVILTTNATNSTTIKSVDNNGYIKETNWLYTDGDFGAATDFKILVSTVEGYEGYQFANNKLGGTNYLYVNATDLGNGSYGVAGNSIINDNISDWNQTVWQLMSISDHNTKVDAYPTTNKTSVIEASGISTSAGDFETYLSSNYVSLDKSALINAISSNNAIGSGWTWNTTRNGNSRTNAGYPSYDPSPYASLWKNTGYYTYTVSKSNLPAGIYKLEMQGFDRRQNRNSEATLYETYGNIGSSYLEANGQKVRIMNAEEMFAAHKAADPSWTINREWAGQLSSLDGNYAPNTVYVYLDGNTDLDLTIEKPDYTNDACLVIGSISLTYYNLNTKIIIDNKGDITSKINSTFDSNGNGWSDGSWISNNRTWHGATANGYYERTTSGTMSCTVENMPAGSYKVVAAARTYAGGKIKAQVAGGDYGTELTGVGDAQTAASEINMNGVQMPYSSVGGFTTDVNGHNWQWINATGTLESAGNLVINFVATGTAWMAIDDVHLYCTELDGTSYTYTVDDDHLDAGDKVVTADIILSNPNAIITSDAAINGAAGTQINNNLVGGTISNMVLYDGNGYTSPAGEYAITNATYYRNFTSGRNATVMVPFSLDATTKAAGKAYTPTRYANDVVLFTTVDEPAVDVPYVFVPSSGITSLTGARTSASEGSKQVDGTSVTFYGTYATTSIEQNNNNYVASNNMLWLVDSDINSNPFRAYLHVDAPAGVKSLSIRLDDATGIQAVEGPQSQKTSIYNLAGQRLNKLQKGINIVNGKKVLVK